MNWGDKMKKIKVGKVVNTHGIKGEIRILSDFQFKDKVFKVNNSLIIGDKSYVIKSYRVHKMFDMVTLDDFNNINDWRRNNNNMLIFFFCFFHKSFKFIINNVFT